MTVRQSVLKATGADEPNQWIGPDNLPAVTSLGGYTLAYLDSDHNVLCWKCASKHDEHDLEIIEVMVLYESCEICDDCDDIIGASYCDYERGDPCEFCSIHGSES